MKYCQNCGKKLLDGAKICICGRLINATTKNVSLFYHDTVSVGLCILSFFIPLFGLIYWAVDHTTTPKRANACVTAVLISLCVDFIMSIIIIFSYLYLLISLLEIYGAFLI